MIYEMVHEILNECPNNQMRDVFIREIETSNPEQYIRNMVKGRNIQIEKESFSDGMTVFHVNCDGLLQNFTFSPEE